MQRDLYTVSELVNAKGGHSLTPSAVSQNESELSLTPGTVSFVRHHPASLPL